MVFGKWVHTSCLVLPRSKLLAALVSMGLLQSQDTEFKAPFNPIQLSWQWVQIPRSYPVEMNLGVLIFSRIMKGSDTTWCLLISKKRNSITFLSLSQFFFLPAVANTKPQTQLAVGPVLLETTGGFVPVVALGVHHELSKWRFLQLQMAVPAPNKEGQGGFCLDSVVSGRKSLQNVQGSTARWTLLTEAILTRLNQL